MTLRTAQARVKAAMDHPDESIADAVAQLGREATNDEIAKLSGVPLERVEAVMSDPAFLEGVLRPKLETRDFTIERKREVANTGLRRLMKAVNAKIDVLDFYDPQVSLKEIQARAKDQVKLLQGLESIEAMRKIGDSTGVERAPRNPEEAMRDILDSPAGRYFYEHWKKKRAEAQPAKEVRVIESAAT